MTAKNVDYVGWRASFPAPSRAAYRVAAGLGERRFDLPTPRAGDVALRRRLDARTHCPAAAPAVPAAIYGLQNRVTAGVALGTKLAEQDHAVFHASRQAPADVIAERIHLRRSPPPRLGHRQPRHAEILPDRVSRGGQHPRDLSDGALLPVQLPELLHGSSSPALGTPRSEIAPGWPAGQEVGQFSIGASGSIYGRR